jgi:hypothetical protein
MKTIRMITTAALTALAIGAAPKSHAESKPNMLTSNASHTYECTIQRAEAPFPQGGKAHLVVNGQTQNITVALRDMLDGDGKSVQGSSWISPLVIHLEDEAAIPGAHALSLAWDLDAKTHTAHGLLALQDKSLMLMTIIPFADWPSWIQKTPNSVPYYGMFDCNEVSQ